MAANIIVIAESVKMISYEILVEDPLVQKWFNYLYGQGRLGETIERITKYYIDYIFQLDEKEPEKYYNVKLKKDNLISRVIKRVDRKPKEPKIKFSLDDILLANGPPLEK